MAKAQYGILRFAKYKGPEIGNIEAHNERTKETYASNPDVDTSRSQYNIHLIAPQDKYRKQAEARIKECRCPRVCSNSVRVVEVLITASPEFFEDRNPAEIRTYFNHALSFLRSRIAPGNFISAVVHMDEKTPHMHVSLCARRAHVLRGESPESARQREGYSRSQGRHREVGSEGRWRQNAGL